MEKWICAWPGRPLPVWSFPSLAKISCTSTTLNSARWQVGKRLNGVSMERSYGVSESFSRWAGEARLARLAGGMVGLIGLVPLKQLAGAGAKHDCPGIPDQSRFLV